VIGNITGPTVKGKRKEIKNGLGLSLQKISSLTVKEKK
jgi:hypothetical protein